MRRSNLIIGLLIAAMALVDACAWIGRSGRSNFVEWPTMILPCLALGQISLTSVWIGIGRAPWVLRVVLGSLALASLTIVFWSPDESFREDAVLMAVQSLAIIACLSALRWSGFRLVNLSEDGQFRPSEATQRSWQFSVRNIIQLTAAAAVTAGIFTQLIGSPFERWLFLIFAAPSALPVPVLTWAILSAGRIVPRIAVALAASLVAAGSWLCWWPMEPVSLAVFCLGQFVLISLALTAVRVSGFRFVRQRAISNDALACQ